MKLVTWNCQGAFRKKIDFIYEWRPDILIIQECEHPDKLIFGPSVPEPTDVYWYSDSGKKGLCLLSFSEYKFELRPEFDPSFRYVLPFRVRGNQHAFTLIAIWAMNNKENRLARYIGQVWLALNNYHEMLRDSIILIGDFNSNKIWDYKARVASHSDVVRKLADNNIQSVYHSYYNLKQGDENHPTFYLYRKQEKPYHIDYCFASVDLLSKVKNVEIGSWEAWTKTKLSDHSPLGISFDL